MWWMTIVFVLLTAVYATYWYAFGKDPKRQASDDLVPYLEGEALERVKNALRVMRETPSQKMTIMARDGKRLYGRYYHRKDGAPIMVMFHGYRGSVLRDAMGAFKITADNDYNLLMVDQRAHGESGGRTISFGVRERYDVVDWCEHLVNYYGENTKIMVIGLSMGAATVMMASDLVSPKNVKGIIADCGYSSPKEILMEVMRQMKWPVGPAYFLTRLGAILFGGFDPEEASAREALKNAKVPVLFIHGEADSFVPCRMTLENYEVCTSEKILFTVPGAEHGMSYMTNKPGYISQVEAFMKNHFEK